MEATNEVLALLNDIIKPQSQFKKICLITFISGGGSALLTSPKSGITFDAKKKIIQLLSRSGSTIKELNQVRKYLSNVKGGQLALNLLQGHDNIEMVNFIASDVVNSPLDVIASGPTIVDSNKVTYSEVVSILKKYKINLNLNLKEEKTVWNKDIYSRLKNVLVLSNRLALDAIEDKAKKLGYLVINIGDNIEGEASVFASKLFEDGIKSDQDKICWIGGGETTVQVPSTATGESRLIAYL